MSTVTEPGEVELTEQAHDQRDELPREFGLPLGHRIRFGAAQFRHIDLRRFLYGWRGRSGLLKN